MFLRKDTYTPVSNPSPVLYEEAQKLIVSPSPKSPSVRFGGIVFQSVTGTLKERADIVLVSLLGGSLATDAWLLTRS